MKTALRLGIATAFLTGSTQAQLFESGPLNLPVPDGDSSGVVSTLVVGGAATSIASIRVGLELEGVGEGGFAGDLYLTLEHGGVMSVLLNRVGSRPDWPGGYGDSAGFSVTLYDGAALDIHQYRLSITGSEVVPLSGPLVGDWQPDGRNADPGGDVWSANRSLMLGGFAGMDPNGTWALFAADVSSGAQFSLKSWSIEITAVPEPEWAATGTGLLAAIWAVWRHRRRAG